MPAERRTAARPDGTTGESRAQLLPRTRTPHVRWGCEGRRALAPSRDERTNRTARLCLSRELKTKKRLTKKATLIGKKARACIVCTT